VSFNAKGLNDMRRRERTEKGVRGPVVSQRVSSKRVTKKKSILTSRTRESRGVAPLGRAGGGKNPSKTSEKKN